MRHEQPIHPESARAGSAESAGAVVSPSRRVSARSVPMGSLVAALLVALWLPSGPLMAAALISGEVSALHAGVAGSGTQRAGHKHAHKSGELRTLKRLSAALIIAVRSSQPGDAGPLGVLRGACPTDEPPLDRQNFFGQRWTNTAGLFIGGHADDAERLGPPGGVEAARSAGLIALPPPARA